MAKYELTIIFKPSLTDIEIDAIIEKLKIKEKKRSSFGKRLLAYPLKSQKEGNYLYLGFEKDEDKVQELKKKLQMEESILRYLLIRV